LFAGDGESARSDKDQDACARAIGGGDATCEVLGLTTTEATALELLSAQPRRTALFCDFDGTIAPLVTDPDASRALPGALRALHELSREMAVVAAVSGRSASFLAQGLELDKYRSKLRAIGLHGLEEWSAGGTIKLKEGVSVWRAAVETVRARLVEAVPAGVRVEDKGYGITVHWRSIAASGDDLKSIGASTTELVRTIGASYGLLARLGKASVELAIPLGIDKGTVVTELCSGLERAGYLGDDLGDVLGFRALDRLTASSGLKAVKVAVAGAEAPSELLEAADLVLDGPGAASTFLQALAGRLASA
jgi:trehalose 6-phosphate phosphatase